MLLEEIKKINTDEKECRKFGLVVGAVFALLGVFSWWRGHQQVFYYFLVPGFLLMLLGAIAPKILKPIYRIWMTLALTMGFIMTGVILTTLYYGVVTPIGLIARLRGKQFLDLKFHEHKSTYWVPKSNKRIEKADFERQF